MIPASLSKSFQDLKRRKARSAFTILTIMLGVMGMSLFAVNPLAERTIDREVEEQNLYNLRYAFPDVEIDDGVLRELESLSNVRSVQTFYVYRSVMISGEGKRDVRIVGVDGIDEMKVDRIIRTGGSLPEDGEVLTEKWNSKNGIFDGGEGSEVLIFDHFGTERILHVSGVGKSLAQREGSYDSSGEAVFYSGIDLVRSLSNSSGFNMLSLDLVSTEDDEIDETMNQVWSVLGAVEGIQALDKTPEIRKDGEWPGGEFLDMFMTIMYVLTVIAVLCSIFFIYNTMNTMISEQRREVAIMKAVGASRLQIFGSFMTTSLIMGMTGAVAGTLLGTMLTYVMLVYFGGLLGFDALFSVHPGTTAASLGGGILLVALSSLPAIIKALGVKTREGLEDSGISTVFGKGFMDRVLMRSSWMPRTVQLGFRNSTRKKGRSFATILQVSLAVGVFLGLVTFGFSVGEELEKTIGNVDYDIVVSGENGDKFLPQGIPSDILDVDGVEQAEPFIETRFTMNGMEIDVMGYLPDTVVKLHEKTLEKGCWLPTGGNKRVSVIGRQLADISSISVGDTIEVMTPMGPRDVEIIGIDSDFYYMGMILYMPLKILQELSGHNDTVSGFHVILEDNGKDVVDRVSVRIEEKVENSGYSVDIAKKYRIVEGAVSQNRAIINMMAVTSLIIVLISMVGLTSNLTMNILDRTREIGVMRCMGAVSSSIRTIFTTEVLSLSIVGWILGIPLGYMIARTLSMIIDSMIEWEIMIHFPVNYVIMGLFMVLIGAFLVAQIPIIRATRIRPGDALR